MNKKLFLSFVFSIFISPVALASEGVTSSEKLLQGYQLQYVEREPGVDDYEVNMLVTDRYIRIDEVGESSGFIIYDDKTRSIYSVSHHDKSILVINKHDYDDKDLPVKYEEEYLQLTDAPKVAGLDIFNYRVYTGKEDKEETCMEIQLVENLLPDVRRLLKNYQVVISGQQVKMSDNKVSDMQPACFFIDQIYNKGLYYDKGLPIQEWHSNEHSKILSSYKKVEVSSNKFIVPEGYKEFSIGADSKTFIK